MHARTPARRPVRRQAGITLIEIMIVLAVLGLMVGMLVIGFGAGKQAEVGRATNQIANTVRYGFDKARVGGEYYRLLIDLDNGTFTLQVGEDAMYLPATNRDGEIAEIDESKVQDQADRDRRAEESFNRSVQSAAYRQQGPGGEAGEDAGGGSGGAAADVYTPQPRKVPRRRPPLFGAFEEENTLTGLAKPVSLPEGVHVSYVRTADDLEPITKGQASLYFFPRGRTQKAHIQITSDDGSVAYTLKIEPLTGRVTVVDTLEDLVLPDDIHDEKDALGRETQRRSL